MESEYRPYSSDNDTSGTDSDSDNESFTDYSSDTNTASIRDVVAPSFLSNLRSRTQQISKTLASAAPRDETNAFSMEGVDSTKKINYGATKFATASRPQTTQIILQSQDRDRTAFPNPTDFTIHFPRTYKNVTNIDLANMNFLNTLLFFRDSRNNTYFDIIETGRKIPDLNQFPIRTDSNSYKLRIKIREGSYNVSSLQQELLYALNTAPPFFYYPNGFSDFAPIFAASGSYALNFNAPGDYFFDNLNNQYITIKTIDDIILRYFSSVTGNQTRYTNTDILVAYYYPVLKEAFLSEEEYAQLNTSVTTSNLVQGEDVYTRVIYNFQGLQDKVIVQLINQNRQRLDLFRNRFTYLTRPINNYAIRENVYNKHLVISATGLSTSIKNTINLNASNTFINALNANNITLSQYNATISSNKERLATLSEMRDLVFTTMAEEFGVPFNSYDIDALFCNNTLFNMQNGINACNVLKSYSLTSNVDIFPDYSKTAEPEPIAFQTLSNLHPVIGSSYDIYEANNDRTKPFAFDVNSALFNDSTRAIFIKGDDNPCNNINILKSDQTLNINPKTRSIDVLATVQSSKYALFKFKSPCRQTIQIETLPIPAKYRYEEYRKANFDRNINLALNKNLEYILPKYDPTITPGIPSFDYSTLIANQATSNLKTIDVSYNQQKLQSFSNAPQHTLKDTENYQYFKFTGPLTSNQVTSLNVTLQTPSASNVLESDIIISHYADLAAFVADTNLSENPLNYKKQVNGGYSQSNSEITLSNLQIRGGDSHYFIVRPKNTNFTNTPFKIYGWYSDSNIRTIAYDSTGYSSNVPFHLQSPESNANMYKLNTSQYTNIDYFKNYDDAYVRLPYSSNLYEGTDPENNAFNDPIIPGQPYEVPIGYDSNGVSTDLTDYKGVLASANGNNQSAIYKSLTRFDPVSGYVFKLGNADNYYSNSQYIASNLTNEIVSGVSNTPYKPTSVNKREYKIVHWNDSHYISPSTFDAIQQPLSNNYSPYIKPINVNDVGNIYNNVSNAVTALNIYDGNYDSSGNIKFGKGVAGFSFLPSDGEWDVNSFMFKSAYFDSNTDPNKNIKYIGVFDTTAVIDYTIEQINIENALCILSNSDRKYYSNAAVDYDKQLGTYHIYKKMAAEESPFKYLERPCGGYTRNPTEKIIQERAFYTALPFDENGKLLTYFMPTGSHIAHEELFDTSASLIADTVYMKQANDWMMPNQAHIFLPKYDAIQSMTIPSYIKSVQYTATSNLLFQSKYEQSIPIITPKIQYIKDLPFFDDQNALFKYDAFDLVTNADTRLLSSRIKDGKVLMDFVKDPTNNSDCESFIHTSQKTELENGSVIRETINNFPEVFLDIITSSQYFQQGDKIICWTRNEYAKYIMIQGNHPVAGKDIKILKLMDNLSTPTLLIAYAEQNNYKQDDSLDESNVRFCVTNDESMMFVSKYDNKLHLNFRNQSIVNGGKRFIRFKYENIVTISEHYCNVLTNDILIYTQQDALIVTFKLNEIVFNSELLTYTFPHNRYYMLLNSSFVFITQPKITKAGDIYFIDKKYPKFLSLISNKVIGGVSTYAYDLDGITMNGTGTNYAFDYIQSAFRFPFTALENNFDWTIAENLTDSSKFLFKWQKKNNYSEDSWDIYGNFQTGKDINNKLQSYSQIFYPTMKIGLTKLKESYNSITDAKLLTNNYLDQSIITPNWSRSQLYLYNNSNTLREDLGKVTNYQYDGAVYNNTGLYKYFANTEPFKWGQESNYIRADNKYYGYFFNSYVYNMTLSNTVSDPNSDHYYLAVRASLPSEGYQTLLRINAPNRLDFGFITMNDLIKEIAEISGNEHKYNPAYLERLISFNQRFKMSNNYFGDGIYSNYPGFPVTTDSNTNYFSNFYTAMSNYYANYTSNIAIINTINSNVYTSTNAALKTYWSDVLPEYVITRERPTDPVTFSMLFKSSLPDAYKDLDEEWGLGWNLGFPKQDLPPATVHFASSIYKIFYETVYLRLADYQGNMNMIDKTGRERLSNTNVAQGETKQYFAKLLLNSFGSFSSTAFQNPPNFNPPIGKLDKLRFQWIDPTGQIIDNAECDWNAVMRITEQIESATAESTFVSYK